MLDHRHSPEETYQCDRIRSAKFQCGDGYAVAYRVPFHVSVCGGVWLGCGEDEFRGVQSALIASQTSFFDQCAYIELLEYGVLVLPVSLAGYTMFKDRHIMKDTYSLCGK